MIQYARGGRRAGWPKLTYVQCRVYTACSTDICKFTIVRYSCNRVQRTILPWPDQHGAGDHNGSRVLGAIDRFFMEINYPTI